MGGPFLFLLASDVPPDGDWDHASAGAGSRNGAVTEVVDSSPAARRVSVSTVMSSSCPNATAACVACCAVGRGCKQRIQPFKSVDFSRRASSLHQAIRIEAQVVSGVQVNLDSLYSAKDISPSGNDPSIASSPEFRNGGRCPAFASTTLPFGYRRITIAVTNPP